MGRRRPRLTARWTVPATAVVAVAGLVVAGLATRAAATGEAADPLRGLIRVDQVGYGSAEAKRAYLMVSRDSSGARFEVLDGHHRVALTGHVGRSTGTWNSRFGAVHPIDFSAVRQTGTYQIRVSGQAEARSARVRIVRSGDIGALAADTTRFFQVQRDGADVVPGVLRRKPAHLTDRTAAVYAQPVFGGDGGDTPAAPLKRIGGPVDVEGGWFDAGDFVKFTHASAYSLAELLVVQRGQNNADHALDAETRHGLAWLDKVWDAQRKVLYVQVGIGTGSEEFGFLGDHDVWRLPEADDALNVAPGDPEYFIKYRPVFPAGAPGAKISPNLAGRVAAAFGLAAQVNARRNPRLARHYLDQGAAILTQAKTTGVGQLVTAFPHAYYPEDSWTDDLEFGATELAAAGRALGDARADGWLRAATHWAKAYLGSGSPDTLNLYDTSALGHADLIPLLRRNHSVGGLEVTEAALLGDLRRQLDSGVRAAARSPFRAAASVTDFDVATRSLGFAATAQLYKSVSHDRRYDAFGTGQRNFVLGANPWGTSLVVGAGAVFPHCPQHQVANLAGSLTGGRRVIAGAVVNGPNGAENFDGLGLPDGGKTCGVDFSTFDRTDSRYMDDVRAWPSSEPAIDFTSTGMLAFALTSRTW